VTSQGEEVDALQSLLREAGQAIRLSGSFDLQTFAALKAWQSAHGLEPCGELDAPSRDYLNQTQQLLAELQTLLSDYCRANELPVSARIAVCCRQMLALARGKALDQVLRAGLPARISAELGPPGRPGRLSDGPQVELLQLMLRSRGERLPLSGRYDEATTAAVRRFQTRSKLPMTGVVDARTAARLDPGADE
jgi:peptidoglycan hydrolase-like protein with peptidoglycan-binding domain